ncbi:hypothetical protein [Pseudobacillus badius]|uniref:hypothetical protein n=1 Tax=Bacillus badius TaxID=1455 RepID=UPI0007B3D501|nr:hypothetical protein [Bacillus badius]KZR58362.1 hypothetical protein A3781_17360 [Bacillus badius]
MKIQKVVLKDIGFKENENGEFISYFTNEQSYPACLTNAALKKGKEMGIIESSLFTDLLKLRELEGLVKENGATDKGAKVTPEMLEALDEGKMQQVIYLGFLGANRNSTLTFDEFLEKYHLPLMETIELYINLCTDAITSDSNQFATELKKSTSNVNKNKKKQKRHR